MTILAANPAGDLWGHPKGLYICFATELWERFSFYGMKYLLLLYLTKYHLFTDAAGLDFAEATADAAREAGVFFRTIGNVLAIAPPYISTPQDIDTVMRTLAQSINAVLYYKAT